MDPLNDGTVPEVKTIPLLVKAPPAVGCSVGLTNSIGGGKLTEDSSLVPEVGNYWLLSSLGSRLRNGDTGNHKEGGDKRCEGNHVEERCIVKRN
jgi:hypothetical protein